MLKGLAKGVLLAVAGLAVAATAWAEEVPTRLQETVISATRTETVADEAPASVSVITREEIESLRVKTVDEVLRYETGVYVKRTKGVADATPRLQLRGLYGNDRTLILLDGLPVNDGYTAAAPWNELAIDNIERIEIIRGPGSALYGGHALGGVINIITRRPTEPEAQVTVGAGEEDTRKLSAAVGQMFWDKLGIRLGYEQESTDGYVTTPVRRPLSVGAGTLTGGYETLNTSGTPQWVVGDQGDNWSERRNANFQSSLTLPDGGLLSLDGQWGRQEYGYDAPNTYLSDSSGNPTFSGTGTTGDGRRFTVAPPNYINFLGLGEQTYSSLTTGLEQEFGKLATTAKVGYQHTDKWYTTARPTGTQNYYNAPGALSDATTRSWLVEFQGSYPVAENHLLTSGVSFRENDYENDSYNLFLYREENSKLAKTEITRGADRFWGIYLQDEWSLPANVTLYLGTRYDWWKAFDGKAGAIGNEQSFSEPDDSAFSPKVSLAWNPLEDTYLRTSYGRAFRPPTIYELYRTWVSGSTTYHSNPDLKPETLWNAEVGADQYFWQRRIKVGATLFHSELDDAIETVSVGNDRFTENVSKAEIDGLELAAEVKPWEWLRLWGNAAWVDSEIVDNPNKPDSEGKRMTNVPVTTYNLGLDTNWSIWTASLTGNYQGRIYTSDTNTDLDDVYAGYSKRWLWNSKITMKPMEHLETSLSVDNLFDKDYYDYYLTPGRTWLAEVTVKW